jgi:hypothetical protein
MPAVLNLVMGAWEQMEPLALAPQRWREVLQGNREYKTQVGSGCRVFGGGWRVKGGRFRRSTGSTHPRWV